MGYGSGDAASTSQASNYNSNRNLFQHLPLQTANKENSTVKQSEQQQLYNHYAHRGENSNVAQRSVSKASAATLQQLGSH